MLHSSKFASLLILLFVVLIYFPETAQSQEIFYHKNEILSLANSVYGSDDRLVNGKYYLPKHPSAKGNPYFLTKDWLDATLYIKGTSYSHIPSKYNIEDDEIIIKIIFPNLISKNILLTNAFIDSLKIDTHIFHNTENLDSEKSIGLAELIYNGSIRAYLKHSCNFIDDLSGDNEFGIYPKPKKELYILTNRTFLLVSSEKEFLAFYPNQIKKIKSFIRKNKIKFKKVSDEQLKLLFQYAEQDKKI